MNRWLWLCSLLALQLQSPSYSKFEKQHPFRWDTTFVRGLDSVYHSRDRTYYRLAQIYCESGFNPRATSDFAGWQRKKIDTVTAIKKRMGAGGLSQFVWPTAQTYGAATVDPREADASVFRPDLYNPHWNLPAMATYMRSIEHYLMSTKNPKARRALMSNIVFREKCATAGYNTGEGRLQKCLARHSDWETIKLELLPETQEYSERIIRLAGEMRRDKRWKTLREAK